MGLKEAYQQKMDAQLKEWSVDIDQLKAKAGSAKADLKVAYEKQLAELRAKHGEGRTKLDEIKESSGDAWEELKTGTDHVLNEIQAHLKSAKDKFK
jgi:hypothetical protein